MRLLTRYPRSKPVVPAQSAPQGSLHIYNLCMTPPSPSSAILSPSPLTMSSSFQDPAFSPTDDAGLLAAARSVLGGTLNSQQDPSFAQPVLYVSGTLAGRTIRGELHELRDLHIDAE